MDDPTWPFLTFNGMTLRHPNFSRLDKTSRDPPARDNTVLPIARQRKPSDGHCILH